MFMYLFRGSYHHTKALIVKQCCNLQTSRVTISFSGSADEVAYSSCRKKSDRIRYRVRHQCDTSSGWDLPNGSLTVSTATDLTVSTIDSHSIQRKLQHRLTVSALV